MEFPHLQRLMEENPVRYDLPRNTFRTFVCPGGKDFRAHGITLFDLRNCQSSLAVAADLRAACGNGSKPVSGQVTEFGAREKKRREPRAWSYSRFGEQVKETKRKLLEFLIGAKRDGKRNCGVWSAGKRQYAAEQLRDSTDFLDTPWTGILQARQILARNHVPNFSPTAFGNEPDFSADPSVEFKGEIIKQNAFIREWGGKFRCADPEIQVHEYATRRESAMAQRQGQLIRFRMVKEQAHESGHLCGGLGMRLRNMGQRSKSRWCRSATRPVLGT